MLAAFMPEIRCWLILRTASRLDHCATLGLAIGPRITFGCINQPSFERLDLLPATIAVIGVHNERACYRHFISTSVDQFERCSN
jgi:hypothetical protein